MSIKTKIALTLWLLSFGLIYLIPIATIRIITGSIRGITKNTNAIITYSDHSATVGVLLGIILGVLYIICFNIIMTKLTQDTKSTINTACRPKRLRLIISILALLILPVTSMLSSYSYVDNVGIHHKNVLFKSVNRLDPWDDINSINCYIEGGGKYKCVLKYDIKFKGGYHFDPISTAKWDKSASIQDVIQLDNILVNKNAKFIIDKPTADVLRQFKLKNGEAYNRLVDSILTRGNADKQDAKITGEGI